MKKDLTLSQTITSEQFSSASKKALSLKNDNEHIWMEDGVLSCLKYKGRHYVCARLGVVNRKYDICFPYLNETLYGYLIS